MKIEIKCEACGAAILKNKWDPKRFCSNACHNTTRLKLGHRYIAGNGYWYVKVASNKYRLEHRVIMEEFIGRKLNADEVVHHRNGNKLDNSLSNLQLCGSDAEHQRSEHLGKLQSDHPIVSKEAIRKRILTRFGREPFTPEQKRQHEREMYIARRARQKQHSSP